MRKASLKSAYARVSSLYGFSGFRLALGKRERFFALEERDAGAMSVEAAITGRQAVFRRRSALSLGKVFPRPSSRRRAPQFPFQLDRIRDRRQADLSLAQIGGDPVCWRQRAAG